jgi:hypothetical protein
MRKASYQCSAIACNALITETCDDAAIRDASGQSIHPMLHIPYMFEN